MNRTRYPWSWLLLPLLLLAACGGTPAPTDAPAPTSSPNVALSAATPAVNQAAAPSDASDLTGRLLFVQAGTIWLWQAGQASPLLGEGNSAHPAWSPDGTRIAFVQRGESFSDVHLADANGSPLVQLTNNGSSFNPRSHERIYDTMWALYPAWQPDGSRVLVTGQGGPPFGSPAVEYNLALYTLLPSSGQRALLYAEERAHLTQAIYTPDSSAVVYTLSGDGRGQSAPQQLHRLPLTSDTSTPYPGAPERSYDPAFSPDGRWLAFAARDEQGTDIWVLPGNADANSAPTPQRLTNLGRARAPVFSPNGQQVAFLAMPPDSTSFELWVLDLSLGADGGVQAGQPRQLTTDMRIDAESGLSWAS